MSRNTLHFRCNFSPQFKIKDWEWAVAHINPVLSKFITTKFHHSEVSYNTDHLSTPDQNSIAFHWSDWATAHLNQSNARFYDHENSSTVRPTTSHFRATSVHCISRFILRVSCTRLDSMFFICIARLTAMQCAKRFYFIIFFEFSKLYFFVSNVFIIISFV